MIMLPDLLSTMVSMAGRGDIDAALKLIEFIPKDNITSYFQTPQVLLVKQVITSRQVNDIVMWLPLGCYTCCQYKVGCW